MPSADDLTTDPEHNSYRNEMDEDPVKAVANAKVPLLFLYGDSDPWIPVGQTLERLRVLSTQQKHIEYKVIANANHEMMSPEGERMEVDKNTVRSNAPRSSAYFMLLADWLARRPR